MSAWSGLIVATCIALAHVTHAPTGVSRDVSRRRAPLMVAPRWVRSPAVAGGAALGLAAAALSVGRSVGAIGPLLGPVLASAGLRNVPIAPLLALVLPGLTDPSVLVGV